MSPSSLLALPLEIRRTILSYCMKKDLLNVAFCSKFFHDEAVPIIWGEALIKWDHVVESDIHNKAGNLKHTQKLLLRGDFEHPENPVDLSVGLFLRSCNAGLLTSLTLSQLVIPDGFEKISEYLPVLQEINLSGVKGSYDFFPSLKQLVSVDIDSGGKGSPITDELVRSICLHLEKLVNLKIGGFQNLITGKSLEYIGHAVQLKSLVLDIHRSLDRNSFSKTISQLNNIVMLKLSSTNVNDSLFDYARQNFRNLKVLHISSTRITSRSLSVISTLHNVQLLDLGYNRGIRNRDLAFLVKLPKLKSLNLEDCDISDEGLKHVSKITTLTSLDLFACKRITDNGLMLISQLRNLRYLNIGFSCPTDKGFARLINLKFLRKLDMYSLEEITDRSLEIVSKMVYLEEVDISYCQKLTEEGINLLKNLPRLRWLQCVDIPGFPDEAVEASDLPISEDYWKW